MNDRYLFKAKRTDNKEWVVGSLISMPHGGYMIDRVTDGRRFRVMINPSTICQCTGLKDKNGNLIWENDIVTYWDTYSTESGLAESDCNGQVVWDDETISFQVTNRLSAESYEVLDECSIIGNIFDNKELLESEG